MALSGWRRHRATSTAPAGAVPVPDAPTSTPRAAQERGELRGGVAGGVVDRRLRVGGPRAEPVVHRERAERSDLAVGAVGVLPGGQVPLRVVARVVADDPAGDPADALGDDRVGERFEAGGHVALASCPATGGTTRSRRWRARDRRRRRARPGRRCRRRAAAGATTLVGKVKSGPRIASAAAATSSFCVDAPMSGVSAWWAASGVVARLHDEAGAGRPARPRRAPPAGAVRRPRRPPARAPAAPTTAGSSPPASRASPARRRNPRRRRRRTRRWPPRPRGDRPATRRVVVRHAASIRRRRWAWCQRCSSAWTARVADGTQ